MTVSHGPRRSSPMSRRSRGEEHDQDQDDRQQEPVEPLRQEHHRHERESRNQQEQRCEPDEECEQAVERSGVAHPMVEPRLPAEGLTRRIGRGQGHGPEPQQGGGQEPDREECLGAPARQRPERAGGIRSIGDVRLAVGPQRRRAGDHDEHRDEVGEGGPEEDVEPGAPQLRGPQALVGHVALG